MNSDSSASGPLSERGHAYIPAASWMPPLHYRHWVDLSDTRAPGSLVRLLKQLVEQCRDLSLVSVTRAFPRRVDVAWGPWCAHGVPRPTSTLLEVNDRQVTGACFRVLGFCGEVTPRCATAFWNIDKFATNFASGQRMFPDNPVDFAALAASVADPREPYGPEPGHYECSMCGSSNVVANTTATWDTLAHAWVMADEVAPGFYCAQCERACLADWVNESRRTERVSTGI